jgi:hypothetical protein
MPPGLYRVGHCSLEQKTKLNREWTRMDTNLDLIAAVAPDVFHLRLEGSRSRLVLLACNHWPVSSDRACSKNHEYNSSFS